MFGKKQVARERETCVRPNLFDDWSMTRMGREVDDICQIMHAKGDFRTGHQLAQTLPLGRRRQLAGRRLLVHGRSARPRRSGEFAAKLHGPLLKFIHEDDRDFLLEHDDPPPREVRPDGARQARCTPRGA